MSPFVTPGHMMGPGWNLNWGKATPYSKGVYHCQVVAMHYISSLTSRDNSKGEYFVKALLTRDSSILISSGGGWRWYDPS